MFNPIKSLLLTETGKDTTIVFAGTLVNVIIGGLFFILAPRILGPADYGLFTVTVATGLMAVNLANFGLDTGILRFANEKQEKRNEILKLALKAYLVIGFLVFLIGLALSPFIANALGVPRIASLLRIAFSGVIFMLLTNFFVATLQTKKHFLEASLVNISSNSARLILLALASYFFTINLFFLTALFFIVTIVSTVVGKLFVPLDFLKAKEENLQFKNFFGYNFWIAASLAISSIPIDNFFLVKLAGPVAVGLYAAPLKVMTTTYQFAGGFSRVLASRFSSFETNRKALEFTQKAAVLVAVVFVVLLLSSFLAPLLTLVFGQEFKESVPIFRILAVGMAFFFADTIPISLILYYFTKSGIAFAVTVFHYVIYALLLLIFISQQGAIGAAYAFTIAEIITFITLLSYIIYKFKNVKN